MGTPSQGFPRALKSEVRRTAVQTSPPVKQMGTRTAREPTRAYVQILLHGWETTAAHTPMKAAGMMCPWDNLPQMEKDELCKLTIKRKRLCEYSVRTMKWYHGQHLSV